MGLRDYFTVRVELARTGGLYEHADVTYRGVSVGRVGDLDLTDGGVSAELRIRNSAPRIPAGLTAHVANLSAVGEQYLDLRPDTGKGPFLHEGSVIPQPDTTVPAPPTKVLASVDNLVAALPRSSLRTVVDELGETFEGRGDDLEVLLDTGSEFLDAADAAAPERPPDSSSTPRPCCAPSARRAAPCATSPTAPRNCSDSSRSPTPTCAASSPRRRVPPPR